MRHLNWDDIRFVLAVANAGTLSGAARVLGVNHATVLRRVAGFEDQTGVALFERHTRGLTPVPGRQRVFAALRAMDDASLGVRRALEAARSPVTGRVRVTSTDTFCQAVLPRIVARVQAQAEGLEIELNSVNVHVDLARLDADIAIRPAPEAPEGLVSTAAGELGFAVYAAPGAGARWLAMAGALERAAPAAWLRDAVEPGDITGRADSFLVLREMAAAGQGRAILPCVLGDTDPRLVRLPGLIPDFRVHVWVASHPDMADVPRIKAVGTMLVEALRQDRAVLAG